MKKILNIFSLIYLFFYKLRFHIIFIIFIKSLGQYFFEIYSNRNLLIYCSALYPDPPSPPRWGLVQDQKKFNDATSLIINLNAM